MDRNCLMLRHLAFEDLGLLSDILAEQGYRVGYHEAPAGLADLDLVEPDLVIVLGGPIGACDDQNYPFLADEIALIRQRLAADRPMLGICLGAQLIARAAGARVYPGAAQEIGFSPLFDTGGGLLSDMEGVPVLHWHGDTFDLPPGASRLASTTAYTNQAFSLGNALGLQFHAEVDPARLEPWLVGHAAELSAAGISPATLRRDAARYSPDMVRAGRAVFERWLGSVQ